MKALVLAALLAGCYRPASEQACRVTCASNGPCPDGLECNNQMCTLPGGGCGEPDDAATQGDGPDAPPMRMCFGSLISVCPPDGVTMDITGSITINTDGPCDVHVLTGAGTACVLIRRMVDITAGNKLRAFGSEPLVLFATSGIRITGLVDASSGGGPNGRGAGADAAPCDGQAANGQANGGGGAGGSFGTAGGDGGAGSGGSSGGGGTAGATEPATMLRGGCMGGAGGLEALTGASGGGAVELISPNGIELTGGINASGAAGGGGANSPNIGSPGGGGGGGGSGGMIVLDGVVTITTGWLRADGGGGGCGGGVGFGAPGTTSSRTSLPAGCTSGGAGGFGGAGASHGTVALGGGPAGADEGGGGGGGGEGVIAVNPPANILDRSP